MYLESNDIVYSDLPSGHKSILTTNKASFVIKYLSIKVYYVLTVTSWTPASTVNQTGKTCALLMYPGSCFNILGPSSKESGFMPFL